MEKSVCTREKIFQPINQNKKSKIFKKFFAKFEKNLLILHYDEHSYISFTSHKETQTYLKAGNTALCWLTKIDCYAEAIPSLLRAGGYFLALDLFENAIKEIRKNDYSKEKEFSYFVVEKIRILQKEFFENGSYEFLGDAFKLESFAITKYEPERATKLADVAKKCEFLENQRWKVAKMVLFALGEDGREIIDNLRFTGDFSYVISYMKKFENHEKQEEIKTIVARANSLQTLKDEIANFIS